MKHETFTGFRYSSWSIFSYNSYFHCHYWETRGNKSYTSDASHFYKDVTVTAPRQIFVSTLFHNLTLCPFDLQTQCHAKWLVVRENCNRVSAIPPWKWSKEHASKPKYMLILPDHLSLSFFVSQENTRNKSCCLRDGTKAVINWQSILAYFSTSCFVTGHHEQEKMLICTNEQTKHRSTRFCSRASLISTFFCGALIELQ